MLTHWGKHAVLNVYRCRPQLIRCPNNITRFSNHLVKAIDMVPYGGPQVQHFGEGNKAGYTLVQLIETSNITGHFCDDTGDAYLDVFSCKDFNAKIVEDLVSQYFRPEHITAYTLLRQAGPSVRADHP
jgi:S-adenosylmethionine/arginine decarboxylase-like enzyme